MSFICSVKSQRVSDLPMFLFVVCGPLCISADINQMLLCAVHRRRVSEWSFSPASHLLGLVGKAARYMWPETWCCLQEQEDNHMQYLCTIKTENPYQSHFLTSASAMSQIYKPLLSDFIPRNASWLTLPSHAACCFWFNLDWLFLSSHSKPTYQGHWFMVQGMK